MNEYKRLDEFAWNEFGKWLLKNKGSDEQISFLQSCKNGKSDFLNYLKENLLNNEDVMIEGESISFDHKFTEAEFRFPPLDTQEIIWDVFGNVDRENMGHCGFWGSVVVNMIEHDCIKPDYLASNLNGVNETGIYMLDSAINSDDDKKIDECVRRILRSMGNPAPRGKRIIFLKIFPPGKAYWRWYWANKMSNEINLSFEAILAILNETNYDTFAENMHSKNSYISQTNTLGGLLLFLDGNNLKGKLNNLIKTISYLSAWKAIEVQSPELNKQEIELIANNL